VKQLSLFHMFKPYFSRIHFNIILPSMPRSPNFSLPVIFSNQQFVGYVFLVNPLRAIGILPISSLFTHRDNVKGQYEPPHHVIFSIPCYFVSINFRYPLSTLFKIAFIMLLSRMRDRISHPYKKYDASTWTACALLRKLRLWIHSAFTPE
jgi:hypothetical protein